MNLLPAFNGSTQSFLWSLYFDINSTCSFLRNKLLESNPEEEITMFAENCETVTVQV